MADSPLWWACFFYALMPLAVKQVVFLLTLLANGINF
jgi:hypothetical protein